MEGFKLQAIRRESISGSDQPPANGNATNSVTVKDIAKKLMKTSKTTSKRLKQRAVLVSTVSFAGLADPTTIATHATAVRFSGTQLRACTRERSHPARNSQGVANDRCERRGEQISQTTRKRQRLSQERPGYQSRLTGRGIQLRCHTQHDMNDRCRPQRTRTARGQDAVEGDCRLPGSTQMPTLVQSRRRIAAASKGEVQM